MRLVLATLTLSCVFAWAQDSARDERWRQDLDALSGRITAAHPNPYTRTSPESFRQEVQELRDRIPALSDRQVVLGFSRILALVNDSHSSISLTQAGINLRRYPIAYRWFSDGLFVTMAPETRARLVGSKVLRIGGKSVEEVYEAVRPWLSHDTESWYRNLTQSALALHDLLAAAGVVQEGEAVILDVEAPDGRRFSEEIPVATVLTVEGPVLSRLNLPLFRRLPTQDYWFDWLPNEKTLYIQYNRCRENALLSIRAFAADIVAFARESSPDRWIFDVRENSGGSSIWFQQLIGVLGAAFESGQVPPPSKGAYGIIGKRTFSSGSLAVRDMRQAGMTLVGETTGGRVYWFGENTPWTLPNSGLSVAVSTRVVGDPATGPEVVPDFPVDFTAADYFANRDPYLDQVLRLEVPVGRAMVLFGAR